MKVSVLSDVNGKTLHSDGIEEGNRVHIAAINTVDYVGFTRLIFSIARAIREPMPAISTESSGLTDRICFAT